MVEDPRVYEIDLTKKYILRFPARLRREESAWIKHEIDQWVGSDKPFLVIDQDVKLVRVDIADQPESED